jgi:thioredoxin-related protein
VRHIYPLPILLALPTIGMLLFGTVAHGSDAHGKFYGAKQTEYPDWFEHSFLDLKDDLAEATRANKRLMLLFTQNGCPYCNALVERNLAQKDIQDAIRKNLNVIHINMWGDREVTGLDGKSYTEKTYAAAMKVQFTPTLLFFDEQGKTVLRLNGYLPPNRFKIAIDYVTQKKEKEIGYREYVAANQPRAMTGNMQQEAFFCQGPVDLRPAAGAKGKPIAVFFEQRDCPDCDTLHGKVLQDKDIGDSLRHFHAVQLDMWSQTPLTTPDGKKTNARDWARALDVKYAPTIVVFNEQGKEIIRSEAMFKVFHTRGIFDYVSSGGYREQPSFQRWLSARADHFREQGKDVDIWSYADEKPQK